MQAAYARFLVGVADEDDARLLMRAGLVEAIYRQANPSEPVGFRIPPAYPPRSFARQTADADANDAQ